MTTTPKRNWFREHIDLIIGIFIGGGIMIGAYFGLQRYYSQRESKNTFNNRHNYSLKVDTLHAGNYTVEIKSQNDVQIKENNAILEEKIKSLNDRIGDFYLSITIIIALVIAIIAGVYIKTETEVSKHMNRNYAAYKKEIETIYGEAQSLISEIRAQATLAAQISPKQETQQTPQPQVTQNDANDGH